MTHPAESLEITRGLIQRQGPLTLRQYVRQLCEQTEPGGLPPDVVVWHNEATARRGKEITVKLIASGILLGNVDVSFRGMKWTGRDGITGEVIDGLSRYATMEAVYRILNSWIEEEEECKT